MLLTANFYENNCWDRMNHFLSVRRAVATSGMSRWSRDGTEGRWVSGKAGEWGCCCFCIFTKHNSLDSFKDLIQMCMIHTCHHTVKIVHFHLVPLYLI